MRAMNSHRSPNFADRADERETMVREHIEARGIADPRVLLALRAVPRHAFVPPHLTAEAYADWPLAIGAGQTISQPYIVAAMTDALGLRGTERVLEVGTGSGYQAAVLATLAREVRTLEIIPELAELARVTLARLGFTNARVCAGDAWAECTEGAPFDAILVAAAPEEVPEPLVGALRVGGRIVLPIGRREQELVVLEKHEHGCTRTVLFPVRFVPMTGGKR